MHASSSEAQNGLTADPTATTGHDRYRGGLSNWLISEHFIGLYLEVTQ
jgi:hypothetical protein